MVTVLRQRREGLAGLGVRRRFLVLSLVVSAILGLGSAYQLFLLASEQGVAVFAPPPRERPGVLGAVLRFGWLFLRWERAFGWLLAILLTGIGFTLQHVGSVPFEAALGFGAFGVMCGIVFAFVRNLAILWPLFYPVASGIGTLQAGFVMGWSDVVLGAVLLVVQVIVLAVVFRRTRKKSF